MRYEKLFVLAEDARCQAYAPFSGFKVGAALLTTGGVFRGCNVENVSFGLTMCAERVAVGAAVAMGIYKFEVLVLVADSGEPVVPCGACRQVLAEFSPDLHVISRNLSGKVEEFSLGRLLPSPRQGIMG